MPRVAVRRKASKRLQNGGNEAPSKKVGRLHSFSLPLPTRPGTVGKALVCGQGDMGQLGLGDDEGKFERKRPALIDDVDNVVDVRAGGMHNLLLTDDGSVFSFGCNDEGALGRDSSGEGSEFKPELVELPGKALRISAGDSHSACLLENGRVYAWGSFRDSHGNMGLTLEGNKRLPIDVLPGVMCCDIASGADHLVILSCTGKVFTVGCAEQGQLGRVSMRSASGEGRRGKTDLLRPAEVIVKRAKPIEHIWATNFCTFLRESDTGNIWAFGLNNYKQLAYAKDQATIINPIKTGFDNIKQIAGGQHHTLVLKNDGSCFVIGRHDYGRLGLGQLDDDVKELRPIKSLSDKKVVYVSCGEAQSFAITDDGMLYSWGMGSNHQLGTGSEDDELEPVPIISKQTQNKRIIRVSSGGQHSIFLVADDSVNTDTDEKSTSQTKSSQLEGSEEMEPIKTAKLKKNEDVKTNGSSGLTKPSKIKVKGNATASTEDVPISPKRSRKKN